MSIPRNLDQQLEEVCKGAVMHTTEYWVMYVTTLGDFWSIWQELRLFTVNYPEWTPLGIWCY